MNRFYYDLHIHSSLSPCADNDNTPNNIAGMASLCGLDIVALTDHNSCKNCPAFFSAAKKYGIIPIAGMELTTSEDIHVVCLFPSLDAAMRFDKEIDSRRIKIKNRKDIFGEQLILDEEDNLIGEDEFLLSNATSISVEDAPRLTREFGGVCYPAHIDREANGIIAVLGTIPPTPTFTAVELHESDRINEYRSKYALDGRLIIVSSDAHYLTDMRDKENFLTLEAERCDEDAVIREMFKLLRQQ